MNRVILFASFIIFFKASALGQERVLELSELLKQVTSAHPALEATQQEIEGAKAEMLGSQGAFDPVLKAEYSGYPKSGYTGNYGNIFVEQPLEWMGARAIAGYRRGGGTFPIYEDYYNTNQEGEARAGLQVPLLRDGRIDRRRASIARALFQIESAELTLQQRKIEIARAAALSYWEWFSASRKFAAYTSLLNTAELRDRQLAQRVKAGDLASIDKVDNERQVLQRRNQLISAERALKKAEYDLGLFLWRGDGRPEELGDRRAPSKLLPPVIDKTLIGSEAIESALKLRVEHKRLQNNLEQQEIELSLAKNQILPRLDIQALAASDFGSGSPTRDESELKGGVTIEIPLATRAQRGRIDSITAKQKEIAAQKRLTEQRIAIEVADAINALSLANSRVSVAREEVRVARELERAEQVKFEQGESNLIFVNLREQTTVDAIVREVEAVADCWKGYVNYQAALGEIKSS